MKVIKKIPFKGAVKITEDGLSPPVFSRDGGQIGLGVRKDNELWWLSYIIE